MASLLYIYVCVYMSPAFCNFYCSTIKKASYLYDGKTHFSSVNFLAIFYAMILVFFHTGLIAYTHHQKMLFCYIYNTNFYAHINTIDQMIQNYAFTCTLYFSTRYTLACSVPCNVYRPTRYTVTVYRVHGCALYVYHYILHGGGYSVF